MYIVNAFFYFYRGRTSSGSFKVNCNAPPPPLHIAIIPHISTTDQITRLCRKRNGNMFLRSFFFSKSFIPVRVFVDPELVPGKETLDRIHTISSLRSNETTGILETPLATEPKVQWVDPDLI